MTQRKAAVFLVIFALTVRFNIIVNGKSDEESSYYYYSSYYSSYNSSYYNPSDCKELSEEKCKLDIGVCPVFVGNYCVI